MIIDASGNVGIGVPRIDPITSSPYVVPEVLNVNGKITPYIDNTFSIGNSAFRWSAIYASNGTINTSDKRQKTNIRPLNYGISEIMRLNPVTFNWISDSNNQTLKIGFIAQEVNEVIKEVINTGEDPNKTLGIFYSDIIPILIKGIQEQQKQIDDLKKIINENSTTFSNKNKIQKIYIEQNIPNPFNDFTEIQYFIINNFKSASLLIYDSEAKQIDEIKLFEKKGKF